MTRADPHIIIKDSTTGLDEDGVSRAPLKSWRTRSGKRTSFGPPKGGWPTFTTSVKKGEAVKMDGNLERRKGHIQICWACSQQVGLGDLFLGAPTLYGPCDTCGKTGSTMQIEQARFDKLLLSDPKNELADEPFRANPPKHDRD